jgi:thiol:disulfide interchange protein
VIRARVSVAAAVLALLGALVPAAAPHATGAQDQPKPGGPVRVKAKGPEQAVPAGDTFAVTLDVSIDEGWHIYAHDSVGTGIVLDVTGADADGLVFERAEYPTGAKDVHVPELDETYRALYGSFAVRAVFRVDRARAPGPATAKVTMESQACTESSCLNADSKVFEVPLQTAEARAGSEGGEGGGADDAGAVSDAGTGGESGRGADDAGGGATTLDGQVQQALAQGHVATFLGLAALLGLVSLLTPCVFPMIPITVSFFSKRAAGEGRERGVKNALAYGLGIIATYTGFGIGMALLVGPTSLQTFATHPWTNLAIGALFVFFGLSLMGFYDLRPPAFLARRAEAGVAQGRSGYLPVFVMGFVFTVTAFTCTAPIVGSLLPLLFTGGSPALIVAGMLAYATAFALPFVLLAMFPNLVGRLPGAGGWMITVKAVLGFLELIAALKFFSNADLTWGLELLSRPVMLMLTLLLAAALALYLVGTYALPHDVPGRRRFVSLRTLFAIAAILLCLYLARGLAGRVLHSWVEAYLPPRGWGEGGAVAGETDPVPWIEDYQLARTEAQRTGKSLFIDFTGITCINCRLIENTVFRKPEFAELMEQHVPVKLHTDRKGAHESGDAANQALQVELGSVTLPYYVKMAPDGTVLGTWSWGGGTKPTVADFATFLEGRP